MSDPIDVDVNKLLIGEMMGKFTCFVGVLLIFGVCIFAEEVVTNPKRSDGFGGQFQTIIASVIYAELHNKKFAYTPFKAMEHNYHNDADFLQKKEWLINFIDNFEINENDTIQQPTHSVFLNFFESNLDACVNSSSLKKIKMIFRANKNRTDYFSHKNLPIAVHVRRPNAHDNRIEGADTPDHIFLHTIHQLRILYAPQNPQFHVYSQGDAEHFTLYEAPDVVLHLNESVEDTFTAMVLADVLVASASSLSYTAGLLSEGIVYYVPFWHAPLPHWISIDTL